MRFLKRHSILAGAILLLLAVILTMVLTGRSKEEPSLFERVAILRWSGFLFLCCLAAPASTFSEETVSAQEEMRAVWVPFMSLDMTNEEQGEEAFETNFLPSSSRQNSMA